ncbi:MAG: hypothetical protein ACPL4H_08780 [Anaerolineales bacterium]
MKQLRFSWQYAIIFVGVFLALRFVMAFNSRVAEMRRLEIQSTQVAGKLAQMTQESIDLSTQIALATSPAGVEQWAYEKGHMQRPGDHIVVPLAPAGATPIPTPTPQTQSLTIPNWKVWLLLFIDETAP